MERIRADTTLAATSENSHTGVPIRGDHFIDDLKVTNIGADRGKNACRESSKEANKGAKLRHREWEYQ